MGLEAVVRVLITGPGGFVGQALGPVLRDLYDVRDAGRMAAFPIADIGPHTDWSAALQGVEAVVHLAGMAHVPDRGDYSQEALFMRVNAEGTRRLAEQAVQAGVTRFILLSSATVMGLQTYGMAWTENDVPQPQNAYARSKLAAEEALKEVAERAGMEALILRPPLMYGPGVKANFLRLMKLAASGLPLPFGSVRNARDMLYVGNLSAGIQASVEGRIPGGTYFITDHRPFSTPVLIRTLAKAMHRPARLLPFPVDALMLAGKLLGRQGEIERLTGDFRLDDTALNAHWLPPYTVEEGLKHTAEWFLKR
jgi:nucleoside-diphosphate-sugar epimerase